MSVDQRTEDILNQLRKARKSDPSETVRQILSAASTGEINRNDLIAFHRDVWTKLVGRPQHNILARYSVTDDLQNTLHLLAFQVLGGRNASEMFRVLVAFVAVEAGLLRVDWTKAAKLTFVAGK